MSNHHHTGGGDDRVYDLGGNLAEWADDRRDITAGSPSGAGSATAIYTTRGGAYDSFFRGMACDFLGTELPRRFRSPTPDSAAARRARAGPRIAAAPA